MIIKKRVEPAEVKLLSALNARKSLAETEQRKLKAAIKGYKGELMFDEWALPLMNKMVFLNDLLLNHQGSKFQIDSCALTSKTIVNFEVKNFEGDYRIKNGIWISPAGEEKPDPMFQLKRTESLLRQYTQQLGFNCHVMSYLIFINPEFYLYNPPDTPSIIFAPQLNRFLTKLLSSSLKLNKGDLKLAEKLQLLHIQESPYSRLPEYHFDDLQKGILCPNCGVFYKPGLGKALFCNMCGESECKAYAILRTIEEFRLLFPNEKLTTNKIQTMCAIINQKKTIRKVLGENFTKVSAKNYTYYE
ncbi:nuclease-related domain-containing protein [Rossellomorea aquimaris]|nr:nuclease-related domain-containing protein [Rossellomorea vietnamensis]